MKQKSEPVVVGIVPVGVQVDCAPVDWAKQLEIRAWVETRVEVLVALGRIQAEKKLKPKLVN